MPLVRTIKTSFYIALAAFVGGALPLHALSLNKTADIAFGMTDYATPLSGAVSLGTNGGIGYSGSFSGGGVGTAAQVEIQDSVGTIVEVSCADGALSDGGTTLTLEGTAVVGSSNVAAWGATPTCAGLGTTILTHTVAAGTAPNVVFIGGRLQPGALSAGTFSTGVGTGQALQLRVVVQ